MNDSHTIWAELPHAQTYAHLLSRVQHIRNTLYYRDPALPPEMHALMNNADASAVLPHFGFSPTANPAYRSTPEQPALFWEREQRHWQLANHLRHLHDDVERYLLDDGRLREHISADAVLRRWRAGMTAVTTHGSLTLRPSLPHYVAATLATHDVPWSIDANGEGAERVLRAQPFRSAPTADPLWLHVDSGLSVHVLCWAVLEEGQAPFTGRVPELAYLSLVGSHKKLRAVWAWLMDSKRRAVKLPQDHNRTVGYGRTEQVTTRRIEAKGSYAQLWPDAPLPDSGLAHLVLQHASESKPRMGQDFLHVGGLDGHPDLTHFGRQWEIASPYPARRTWAAQLWQAGLDAKLIHPLTTRGMSAWWVTVDDPAWDCIIASCAAGRTVDATTEVFGQQRHTLVEAAVDDTEAA